MKFNFKSFVVLCGFSLLVSSCGPQNLSTLSSPAASQDSGIAGSADTDLSQSTGTPFDGLTRGDGFGWGQFIRNQYKTTRINELPINIYCAFFSDAEKKEIYAGIDLANEAVGFEVFRPIETYSDKVRVIYKVDKIEFEDEHQDASLKAAVGYTFALSVYPWSDKEESGRVVVDWAMEIKSGFANRWVIAHELGHAMGIQKHSMIDYLNDELIPLEPNSLMNAIIPEHPVLDDYTEMMQSQGELLSDYISN